jgi:D-alanyl-D-alanine dipeptidase
LHRFSVWCFAVQHKEWSASGPPKTARAGDPDRTALWATEQAAHLPIHCEVPSQPWRFKLDAMKLLLPLIFSAMAGLADAAPGDTRLGESNQCILVIAESWTAIHGTARWFSRTERSKWLPAADTEPVMLGMAGLAWGRGVIDHADLTGPVKREGDNKSPAGIFRLGPLFGRATRLPGSKMRYIPVSTNFVAVDDPASQYYNQIVDRTRIAAPDWRSAESMALPDPRYKWGIFVQHNTPPVPGAGSCIFLHVWKNSQTPTSGCTALSEEPLVQLMRWLDPAKRPLLVQLPRSIYNDVASQWGLPVLDW